MAKRESKRAGKSLFGLIRTLGRSRRGTLAGRPLGCEPLEQRQLLTAGHLDLNFGQYGMLALATPGQDVWLSQAVQQPDGKVVSATTGTLGGSNPQMIVGRYTSEGLLDPSFGNQGFAAVSFAGCDTSNVSRAVVRTVAGEPKILIVGSCYSSAISTDALALAQLDSAGNLDSTFGDSGEGGAKTGTVTLAIADKQMYCDDVAIQTVAGAANILVLGSAWTPGSGEANFLIRFDGSGSLDTTFGTAGVLTLDVGEPGFYAESLAALPGGKFLVGGTVEPSSTATPGHLTVVRFNSDGTLDTSFGRNGLATVNAPSLVGEYPWLRDITLENVGGQTKIVALGNQQGAPVLARFNEDGSVDTSFGQQGVVTLAFGRGETYLQEVGIQGDGKIVVIGERGVAVGSIWENYVVLARLNPADGSLDANPRTGFGEGGISVVSVGGLQGQLSGMLRPSDGSILAFGNTYSPAGTHPVLMRFSAEGPRATADTYWTENDSVLPITAPGLLSNDSAYQVGSALRVTGVNTSGTFGIVTFEPSGGFTYKPAGVFDYLAPGETAIDQFAYTLTDGSGKIDTAMVTITVFGGPAVLPLDRQFKTVAFTTSDGQFSGSRESGGTTTTYQGTANVTSGTITFYDPATGDLTASVSGSGQATTDGQPTDFSFTATVSALYTNGTLGVSGGGGFDLVVNPPELAPKYAPGGSINPGDLRAYIGWWEEGTAGRDWSGTPTPTTTDPFDIRPTAATWNGSGITVDFAVDGPLSQFNPLAADYWDPVSDIRVFWASGPSTSNILEEVTGAESRIPIYWNQASGRADVFDLPVVP